MKVRTACAALVLLAAIAGDAPAAARTPAASGTSQSRRAPAKPVSKVRTPPAAAVRAAAQKVERPVPFKPGETLTFDVSWSMSFFTAGTATVSVRDKRASFGSTAYYIVGEARPTPTLSKLYALYYKVDTLLDAYTLTPQRGSVYSDENGRRRMKSLRFNQAARTARFEMQTASLMQKDLTVPAAAQDALSVLFMLRASALKPGARLTVPVCVDDAVYTVTATVGGREDIKTGLGTVPAVRITPAITDAKGNPTGRGLALWLSDDARRLPLKLQAELAVGSFNLVLREAK